MTSITWEGPRYVQELGTFLGPENRTQRRCALFFEPFPKYLLVESEVRRPHHHQGCALQLGVGLAETRDRGPEPCILQLFCVSIGHQSPTHMVLSRSVRYR